MNTRGESKRFASTGMITGSEGSQGSKDAKNSQIC